MANANWKIRFEDIKKKMAARSQSIQKRVGKPLMFDNMQVVEAIRSNKVPTQMQHCILKVFPKMPGDNKEKFVSAFNICGAVFGKNGYQKLGTTTLTSKGLQNNIRHRRELNAGAKKARYEQLSRVWLKEMEALEKFSADKTKQEVQKAVAKKDDPKEKETKPAEKTAKPQPKNLITAKNSTKKQ